MWCTHHQRVSVVWCPIRGYFHRPGIVDLGFQFKRPNNCYQCGMTYPWTANALEQARELTDELMLTDDEKATIKDKLPDIVQDSPTAEVSAVKVKGLLDKARTAGNVAAGVLYKVLIDYASETTKKIFMGPLG